VFEGYPNYDKSEFDSSSAFFEDDSEIERVWKQSHSLKDVIDPKNFKPYDELKAKLHRVLGIVGADADLRSNAASSAEEDLYGELDMSKAQAPKKETPAAPMKEQAASTDEDEDDLEFFRNLSKT
jgi:hypothetical protein